MENFLSLRGLSVGYPDRVVLQNIDLEILRGEILSVIGPNGAGKSTLLKSISGQLALLGGSVVMQGEDIGKCSAAERAREMAVVLTEHIRPEYMTCREVVSAGRYPYTGRMGILQPRDKEIVEEAMARMKVTELSERDFNAISDGQKQRVLVARAIAQDTPVLLLDEPTSYLDLRYRTELMETLKDLAREGRTVLMSLHEIDLALEVSDRILCVQEGKSVWCGNPREVLEQDRIRDLFGMPGEMYEKLFGETKRRFCGADAVSDHTFFTNRSCKYFPCHKGADPENFNCLFCYCPLYVMGPDCGGNYRLTSSGVKDCTGCLVPHRRENYEKIMEKLRARNRAAAKTAAATADVQFPDTTLQQVISDIQSPSKEILELVRGDLSRLAMPPGSLGKIETTAARMAAIQKRRRPRAAKRRIIVLCADNGVVEENVSSAPREVTARQAVNMTKGLTGMSSIAAQRGDEVQVVDMGIATPYECAQVLNRRIRRGTDNIAKGPAMTMEEAEKAVMTGISLAYQAFAEQVDIVGVGEMGIGNTTTSAAVISVLTGAEPAKVTGFGGGITEQAYLRKVQCVQRAIEVNKPDADDPMDVLAKVGGFDLAAMCGVFLGCAKYGIPAVIDGVISAAAALCAVRMCPACRDYLFPSHQSVEPGYMAAMEALGIEPWFKLDMRLGEGSGCTMSFAVMEAACAILERMATFEKAGIDDSYLEEIREAEKKDSETKLRK
ncbi:MAG: nicotinate-nucleotide--dimethylbenzimidazole phosphoribosyltransferase [Lachnospiraceae bacterium]|nr:nicotinate-nucleotide--dimethylbenzimidazole phosphoribosyltransferase [Lachnospiraceae bacterium]